MRVVWALLAVFNIGIAFVGEFSLFNLVAGLVLLFGLLITE